MATDAEMRERDRFLASFVERPLGSIMLKTEPGLAASSLAFLELELSAVRARAKSYIGLDAALPPIYLYSTPETLRKGACVNGRSVAFYDGALHLALMDEGRVNADELTSSLDHEYMHHVLQTNGIFRPTWFQEGVAMLFGRENWQDFRFNAPPIALEQMVGPIPRDADAAYSQRFYGQSYAMARLIQTLCAKPARCSLAEVARALLDRRVSPEQLFDWALQQSAPTARRTHLALLENYVRLGFTEDPLSDD